MIGVICTNCRRPYPTDALPYRCLVCGGVYDLPGLPAYHSNDTQKHLPGIWHYRDSFGLPENAPFVSLGEGNTSLIWGEAFGRKIAYKLEFLNPSGSYKDRGSAVLASLLKSHRITEAVEDSSGNAGASFAAYAARAGIQATIFLPEATSGPKQRQISAYGARIQKIAGSRSDTALAVKQAADSGAIYASHAFLPQVLAGYATIAYEIFAQLGQAPGAVITPAGQGNLLLAIGRGFRALQMAGLVGELPVLVGVQARACAPLWAAYNYGVAGMSWVTEGRTIAEGVCVKYPLRGDAVLTEVFSTKGYLLAVDEEEIIPGRDAFARQGLYIEPTSAIVWNGLSQSIDQLPEPIVLILTGSGLKYQE